jgi:hypothetical protein
VNRAAWRRAVGSEAFPRELRSIRGTLLLLAAGMTADGELNVNRARLIELAALPPRSLDRHLARAVNGGWLNHVVHGGHGRRSRYQATSPSDSCAPLMADNTTELRATNGIQLDGVARHSLRGYADGVARHLVANSIDKGEQSEHLALDQDRERRTDHNGDRVSPEHDQTKDGSEDKPPARLALVADSPRARAVQAALDRLDCTECNHRSNFGQPPCEQHQDADAAS